VIPAFERMFTDFGGGKDALPKLTQIVVALSHGFVTYLPFIAGGVVASVVGFLYTIKTPRGKRVFHKALLNVPLIGPVLRKIAVARFTRTLGTLLQSGVPILDALEICAKTSGNVVIESGVLHVRQRISEGRNMAEPLNETKIFPDMVVQMIAVGEQTGAMDAMLQKIADFYEDEVDVAVASLTSLMEPVMMVFLGGTIGGLIIAMYLPIFELAGNISAE
jgi:type IV pilus assembly protein PilC